MIEGDIDLLSTAATSARRERALGGVLESLGRLDRLEEEGRDEDASLLRSGGKTADGGFKRAGFALGSLP